MQREKQAVILQLNKIHKKPFKERKHYDTKKRNLPLPDMWQHR